MQFRTKARAVDLLGKGQIADLPTAITELWKNGYDAYADNLTAEIYLDSYKDLKKPMFVITDDGKGMSEEDIFNKWLVLGSDSKSRIKNKDKEGVETLWKKARIKAGEKGIGRLSVAFLGSPMLMLTKKIGHPLQALFFDWRLLENYNLFLDDVNIPIEEIDSINTFSKVFEKLKKDFLKNFSKEKDNDLIWEDEQAQIKVDILSSINEMQISSFFETELISDIIDLKEHHGTKFIIFEPIEQIINLTKSDEDNTTDKKFVLNSLSGFTNGFKKGKQIVSTSIPIHEEVGADYDLLVSSGEFYTHKDFELADVFIKGKFDGKGEFAGSLRIYDEVLDYNFSSSRKKDRRNDYGAYSIELGYNLGNQKSSFLGEEKYSYLKEKLNKKGGGLFIYRDNFRVLPYGRTDSDFLKFEKRRTFNAGEHFFSHRRMFGYIDLTRKNNDKLRDKSSREGLINNGSYRAFVYDLISFFSQTTSDFFGRKPKSNLFKDKKEKVKEQNEELEKDKNRVTQEKKAFTESLKVYPIRLEEYRKKYVSILQQLDERTIATDVLYSEIESLLDKLQSLDIEYDDLLPKVPKRYEPTELQLDRLNIYEENLLEFEKTIKKESRKVLKRVKGKLKVKELKVSFAKNYEQYLGNLQSLISKNKEGLEERFDSLLYEYSSRGRRITEELEKDKVEIIDSIQSKEQVIEQSERVKEKFEFLREQVEKELSPLVEHLQRVSFDIDEELLQGAYKAKYETIKYQWEQTRETAQLGIAVEIIDHEFNQLYAKINRSIEQLSSNDLFLEEKQFLFLKNNFKQLEDKYDLLSPLYRISGVIVKNVECKSIFEYLEQFFGSKIKSRGVEFSASKAFLNHSLSIKEPVIYTVFINIVNNAFYWIRNSKINKIEFDYLKKTKEIVIRNSGEKIGKHRIEKIFELFYSNRPNGRGIGLYLSKQSLNENYLDIYATNEKSYNTLNGACFVIKHLK